MWLFYDTTIFFYGLALRIAALFNPKARLWVRGRLAEHKSRQSAVGGRQSFINQKSEIRNQSTPLAWFHCASLGEFEQGRPVIEAFRAKYPDWKILLTFFSPSGYEVRKNYEGADIIRYLPLDTPRNAREFIDTFRPELAVFVKYEFWYRYIDRLHRENIPTYLISGIFRPTQHFFRSYGSWARKQLAKFSHFFVQDESSEHLLQRIGLRNVTVSGDTRFDRVAAIAENGREFPLVERFARGRKVVVAGSTWPADEELLIQWLAQAGEEIRLIIAPHEVGTQRVQALCKQVGSPQPLDPKSEASSGSAASSHSTRSDEMDIKHPLGQSEGSACALFSDLTPDTASGARVLIVDGIGYLSHLYRYATVAYIGGGFGVGIHNILEAATFGKPVIFGPNYEKFREAKDLVRLKGAYPVHDEQELKQVCSGLLEDENLYLSASEKCKAYVSLNRGATAMILEGVSVGSIQ